MTETKRSPVSYAALTGHEAGILAENECEARERISTLPREDSSTKSGVCQDPREYLAFRGIPSGWLDALETQYKLSDVAKTAMAIADDAQLLSALEHAVKGIQRDPLNYLLEQGFSLDELRKLTARNGFTYEEVADAVEKLVARGIDPLAEFEIGERAEGQRPLDTISAVDLQQKDLPPIRFIVDKLLPVGLNILASPPKYGKSWMVLALCIAVASGGRFLGYTTNQCGCIYLALEDSQRRLKTRMNKLLAGKPAPAGFHFATTASPIDQGLFDELEGSLKKHPDTGLIVVDTLQRVRGAAHGREGAYAADYREVGALKTFADQHTVALLLVHHLRKMKDDGDPFNMISGTNGIMGAADTTMVLTKEKRGDSNATFSIVGRDVESSDTVLRFNKDTCCWENLGDADWFSEQQARQEYQESPIVQTVKRLLEQSPEGWSGTAQQLMDAGRFIVRRPLADSTQGLSKKLQSLDRLLFENDGIVHERKKNGSGGGKHKFYFNTAPQFEELEQTEFDPFLGG